MIRNASGLATHDRYAYVTDSYVHVIFRVHMFTEQVELFVGRLNCPGFHDGPRETALFNCPSGITFALQANLERAGLYVLVVMDTVDHWLYFIKLFALVTNDIYGKPKTRFFDVVHKVLLVTLAMLWWAIRVFVYGTVVMALLYAAFVHNDNVWSTTEYAVRSTVCADRGPRGGRIGTASTPSVLIGLFPSEEYSGHPRPLREKGIFLLNL